MKQKYHKEWFKEDGAAYPVRIFLLKDEVTVALDTSGDSLHKRGYRTMTSKAPLTETLAASLIMLTPWRKTGFWSIHFVEVVPSRSRQQ